MKIPVQTEAHDRSIGFDIAGKGNSLSSGTVVNAPGGVQVEFKGIVVRRSVGIPEVLQLIVDASVDVELGLFSAWLYDKVRNKPVERIILRRTEITEITEESIRKALEEEIEIDR